MRIMKLEESDIQEFQRLYEEAYGEKLTEAEASKAAASLVYLYEYLVDNPVKEESTPSS